MHLASHRSISALRYGFDATRRDLPSSKNRVPLILIEYASADIFVNCQVPAKYNGGLLVTEVQCGTACH